MERLVDIEKLAREELRDRWENYHDNFDGGCESDVIHEIADSCVPVYTSELLELAASDNSLAVDEPELGPAFDGSPTPVNVIAANVYERLCAVLWDEYRELEEADEPEDEPQEDDGYIFPERPLGTKTGASFNGRYLGSFDSERRARAAIRLESMRSRFYPNVWSVNDHGGQTLLA